jgi:NAD(P)-dependent dehydrogenase (short-subunit alcohol dehydrogenase family)
MQSDTATSRVAIVTGAGGGIGTGLVAGFRAAGYAVVGTSLSIAPSQDDDLVTVAGDISQPEVAQQVVDAALDRFGRIDSLVNCAGIYIEKPFTDYTLKDFASITSVNLAGFFHITQRVLPTMVKQGVGHIVQFSTSLVDYADHTRPAALASLTKGGLVAATRSLAIEYASRHVRVNAVSLGVIRTPMHGDASWDGVAELHPLNRIGDVDDVVDGVLYLERATFVTGETLHIDGGQVAGH